MEFDREKYVRQLLEREHNGLIPEREKPWVAV